MSNLELHPLCTLFPRMSGTEFDALKADIVANGLSEPIVVHDGFILDGGNRYRACVEAGIEPVLKDFAGANPASFVLSANLHRRHLTSGQQAAIVASAQDWASAQPAHRPGKGGNVAGLNTVADRAAQSGASDRTQRMADKVAKASPELAKQVGHGKISLPEALKQLAPRPSAPAQVDAHDDAPDFEIDESLALDRNAAAAPAPVSLDDLEDPPDTEELLAEEQAKVEKLEGEVRTLKARVHLLESGDLAAKIVALELDRDGLRNRAASHYQDFTKANTKVIDYKKLLDKLCKLAGVKKYGELAARIMPAARG